MRLRGRSRWSKLLGEITADSRGTVRCTGLLVSLRKASQWPAVLDLFAHMRHVDLRLDVICWNAALAACQRGCWQFGIQLLEEMKRSQVTPNASTHNTLISACAESSAWSAALALLSYTTTDVRGLGAALSACGRAEKWRWAVAPFAMAWAERNQRLGSLRRR